MSYNLCLRWILYGNYLKPNQFSNLHRLHCEHTSIPYISQLYSVVNVQREQSWLTKADKGESVHESSSEDGTRVSKRWRHEQQNIPPPTQNHTWQDVKCWNMKENLFYAIVSNLCSIHIYIYLYIYSAFANSCPLQTDTLLFPIIHNHNVLLSSNKF